MLPGVKKRGLNFYDLLIYLFIARKHMRLMILLLCFSWLSGLIYYVYARPIYFSRSLIKIDQIDRNISAEKSFNEGSRLGSIIQEIRSPHIIERTASRLGIKSDYREITKNYIKKLSLKRNSEWNIEVEIWTYSIDWAKDWTESMLKEYLDYRFKRRLTELKQRQENYNRDRAEMLKLMEDELSRLFVARAEGNTQEAKIQHDKIKTLHSDIVETARKLDEIGRAKLQLLSDDLDTVSKLSIIASLYTQLPIGSINTNVDSNIITQNNLDIVTPILAENSSEWQVLEKQINLIKAEKTKLLNVYLPLNPKILELDKQISDLQVKLDVELKTSIDKLNITHKFLIERQKVNESKRPEFEKYLKEMKRATFEEDIYTGASDLWKRRIEKIDKEIDDEIYSFNKNKIEATYGGILQINNSPVSPNRFSLFLYSTIFGILLAVGIPFLIEYLDHTLSNLEQVESAFQIKGLGIIPKISNYDSMLSVSDNDYKDNSLLENFRVIRTNILSIGSLTKSPHVIMVTSAMPKEGKTAVSSNLSLSFAQMGAKTLLLDTDLRRGRLHRLFGYRKQPGLSNVLMGSSTLSEAIRPTFHSNLFILSAGQHLESGTELLSSEKFRSVIKELRSQFERIVIDTPPVLGLSETSILQPEVDGVLFVIWSGHTPIKNVKSSIEILQSNGANFYGFVLNRLDLNDSTNYYQYYYYSSDYYYHYQPSIVDK